MPLVAYGGEAAQGALRRPLRVEEFDQSLIVFGRFYEFEPDLPGPDRPDDGRHLNRRLLLIDGELEVEDILLTHRNSGLNQAASQGDVLDDPLAVHPPAGEAEEQPDWNAPVRPAIQHPLAILPSPSESQEPVPAGLALEGRDQNQRGDPFPHCVAGGPEDVVFSAVRTDQPHRLRLCFRLFVTGL